MGTSAVIVTGVFLGFGGLVAYLVGVGALAETRRLRRDGVPAWAQVMRHPAAFDEVNGVPGPLLQFTTRDGAVVEVFAPVPSGRSRPLAAGERVRVAYDPADPRQVLVLGRERRGIDFAFAGLGVGLALAALVLLISAA
ncbi:DUF3592 domain-containing protein [Streptacidiphilus sp. N1-12]|uniref:DUF3592 domain-containing protein n=2 Tax=Streptacidiphilus alkalitolerans TaxID=3342712 RepID=A0ABV6WL99_9ACTN